jgi:hypothetical protein|nr:MAG TPA: adenine-specific methyltransferase [Herelleviridae sp.]
MNKEFGQLHKIGVHRVMHSDLFIDANIEKLVAGDKVDIFYCDPPWGTGAIKMFHTMNKKMTGVESANREVDNNDFLIKLLTYAKKYTKGYVVIEYGNRWVDAVKEAAKHCGLHFCGMTETLYGGKPYTMQVLVFHTENSHKVDLREVYHTKDGYTPECVIRSLYKEPNQIVMDLCCGLGNTARACKRLKLKFLGNELNSKRLEKTIKILENG